MNCIDWLTYRSYEAQRINSPHIKYQRWGILFPNIETLETIYKGMNPMMFETREENRREFYIFLDCYSAAIDSLAQELDIDWHEAEKVLVKLEDQGSKYLDKFYPPLVA